MFARIVFPVLFFGLTVAAVADEFAGEDFSLRLPAALSSFSAYADVAGKGGASVAGRFGSSANPAAMAWSFPNQFHLIASAQFSSIAFENGTRLKFFSEALTFDAGQVGAFRFSFGKVTSNDREVRTFPVDLGYDLNSGRIDWAKRLGSVSIGVSVSHSESETTFHTRQLIFSDSDRQTTIGRLGVLWQPAPKWLIGAIGEFGHGPTRTTQRMPTLAGVFSSDARDITRQVVLRAGVSYEWMTYALLQLDYQHGTFWNDTGSLDVDRFSVGADLPLAKFLFVRAGSVGDVRGNFGWTAGVGLYPRPGLTLDFAYQNDAFPELQRELGHSRTLNASVSVQF